MPITLSFKFSSVDNAKNFMVGLGKKSKDALESAPVATEAAPPIDLSGGPAEQALASIAPPAPTESVGGMLGLGGGAPAIPAPAVAAPVAAPAPVVPDAPLPAAPPVLSIPPIPPAPPAPPAPAGLTQANVIAAFTQLGASKGRDAIATLLGELGVTTVVQIPEASFVDVLNQVNVLLNA